MAKMDLKTLIRIAPLSEEAKKHLLEEADTFDNDLKYEIMKILYLALAKKNDVDFRYKLDAILEEAAQGKRPYNVNDFTEALVQKEHDLTQKVEKARTEQEIEEVRSGLKTAGKSSPS